MKGTLLKSYKARKTGLRGISFTLPAHFIKSNNIKPGDSLDVYMTDDPKILAVKIPEEKK